MTFLQFNDEEILGPRGSGTFIAQHCDELIKINNEAIINVAQMVTKF